MTTVGTCSLKERKYNFSPDFAPLEHYHTILMDEKYQKYDFCPKDSRNDYFRVRKDLVEMLFETGRKLRQTQSSVYLAIRYMDIILNTNNCVSQALPEGSFKVIAVVCLYIAAKFDALDLNTPYISELQKASSCFIPYEALIKYEEECLKILNWNLKAVTLYHTLDAIKQQGIIFSSDTRNGGAPIEEDLDQTLNKALGLLNYFMDFMIKEPQCSVYRSTHQAAACILATRKCLGIDEPFSPALSEMILLSEKDIPTELSDSTQKLLSLLEPSSPEKRMVEVSESAEKLKATIKTRVNALEELHDFSGRISIPKRSCLSTSLHQESSSSENEEFVSSEGLADNGGYFYYEDNGLPIPYNMDGVDLSYIQESLQQQMMYGDMPLGQIRAASAGSEGVGNFKNKISSLLGANTKGSTSGKENYEDLNNEESPLFLEEFYNLEEKVAFHSPSALLKLGNQESKVSAPLNPSEELAIV